MQGNMTSAMPRMSIVSRAPARSRSNRQVPLKREEEVRWDILAAAILSIVEERSEVDVDILILKICNMNALDEFARPHINETMRDVYKVQGRVQQQALRNSSNEASTQMNKLHQIIAEQNKNPSLKLWDFTTINIALHNL